jgi:hypothetical protein
MANPWMQNNIPVTEDGPGVKVGDNSRFHPGFAATVGFDSNVFWEERSEGKPVGGYLTPSAWLGIGNRRLRDGVLDSPATATARKVDYNLRVLAGYRQYLSSNLNVREAGKFNLMTTGRVIIMPGRRFSVGLSEDFYRLGEPRTFEAARAFNFNRLQHDGRLKFTLRPGGGKFEVAAAYRSHLLYFEAQDLPIGDRIGNGADAEFRWRFRDQTALVVRYQFMNTFYLCCGDVQAPNGMARNEDSNAHRATAGVVGQVGKKWQLDVMAGYGGGFYKNDVTDHPQEPDFSSFIGHVGASFYPTMRSRISARFGRKFQDSLLGNYFTDLGGSLYGAHEFRWRMLLQAGVGAYQRVYYGMPEPGVETSDVVAYTGSRSGSFQRQDLMVSGSIQLEQALGRFFVVAVRYAVTVDSTDFTTEFASGFVDEAGFNKHLVMLFGAVRY